MVTLKKKTSLRVRFWSGAIGAAFGGFIGCGGGSSGVGGDPSSQPVPREEVTGTGGAQSGAPGGETGAGGAGLVSTGGAPNATGGTVGTGGLTASGGETGSGGTNNPNSGKSVLETGKFVHPGILSTQAQLDYVKEKIEQRKEPWWSAFRELEDIEPHKRIIKPRKLVKNEPNEPGSHSANRKAMDEMTYDGSAIYAAALLWVFTGDKKYHDFAIGGLNDWAIYESGGMPLYHTWMVPQFLNGAEIMAHYPGSDWKSADLERFQKTVRDRFWRPVRLPEVLDSNHACTATEAQLAIAVFTDDVPRFKTALANHRKIMEEWVYLNRPGRIDGETGNTCRDLSHTVLGTHGLMYGAETLWNQNIDEWKDEERRWRLFAELHAGIMMDTHPSPNICARRGPSRRGVVYCAGRTGEKEPPCQETPWHLLINHIGDRLGHDLPRSRVMEEGRILGTSITHRARKLETVLKANVPADIK